ncbi:hypothetical protein TSAR_008221 [Trichomalopsis sarcophagae]|uniref:Uncharacterized protein n=1 Tax=Trichomalopsis sarcophagae TaxID=543379 RepID=A0A232FMD8_9HYME|nr:hypothetical protein TSAR_008221 [Trichomalopsis sarcophagae]
MSNPDLSDDDASTDEETVIRDFEAEAQLVVNRDTLPKRLADRYNLVYETFQKWKVDNNATTTTESVLIVYFEDLKKRLSPTTLWSVWSMLKKTLNTRDSINIKNFHNLKILLKNNNKGYKPVKAYVLEWEKIMTFLKEEPDNIYLAAKVSTSI